MGSRCGRRQTVQLASFVAQNSYSLKMKKGFRDSQEKPRRRGSCERGRKVARLERGTVRTCATDEFFPDLSGTFGNRHVVGYGRHHSARLKSGSSEIVKMSYRRASQQRAKHHLHLRKQAPVLTIVAIDTICMTATRISENRHDEPRSRRKADMVEVFGRLVYVLGWGNGLRHGTLLARRDF